MTDIGICADMWHDDRYEKCPIAMGPDDSDGYREYNGLPIWLVCSILEIYHKYGSKIYFEIRTKILALPDDYDREDNIENIIRGLKKGDF